MPRMLTSSHLAGKCVLTWRHSRIQKQARHQSVVSLERAAVFDDIKVLPNDGFLFSMYCLVEGGGSPSQRRQGGAWKRPLQLLLRQQPRLHFCSRHAQSPAGEAAEHLLPWPSAQLQQQAQFVRQCKPNLAKAERLLYSSIQYTAAPAPAVDISSWVSPRASTFIALGNAAYHP